MKATSPRHDAAAPNPATIFTMELSAKADRLDSILRGYGSLLVAYSGGTDSAYLAWAAHQALDTRMLAVIADSPSLPREELRKALAFSDLHGIPTEVVSTAELNNPHYARNDANRCFHCKDELFDVMEQTRQRLGFAHISFGMNTDDRGDHRPGQTAASNHGVVAPLVEASLAKAEIRQLAQNEGLSLHNKPASACLASRIAYGLEVTPERLQQVEEAENLLHSAGFSQVRVRHHGDIARIEVAREDLPRILHAELLENLHNSLQKIGFSFVSLDMIGYRSGSMNDLLPASAITSAAHG